MPMPPGGQLAGQCNPLARVELYGRETAGSANLPPLIRSTMPSIGSTAPRKLASPEGKRTMFKVADDYERLAQRAQERAVGRWLSYSIR
jgi:hypothetical protein